MKAREEMSTLVNEARNIRSALDPIEQYAAAGYATAGEKMVILRIIANLRLLDARLNEGMLSQLSGRVSNQVNPLQPHH